MSDPGPDDPSGRFCREVERAFVARRGGASVVSPADWQLILDWERRGIPLPVVVEGIGRAFDDREFDGRASASGRLRLRACAGAVEAAFAGYRRRRAGLPETAAASEPAAPSPADAAGAGRLPSEVSRPPRPSSTPPAEHPLRVRLLGLAADLRAWQPAASAVVPEPAVAAASRAAGRIADLAASLPANDGEGNRGAIRSAGPGEERPAVEPDGDFLPSPRGAEGRGAVETCLEAVEEELLRSLAEALRPEASAAITAAAAEPLAAYRRRMPPSGYREALAAAVRRRLPRALALPPLRLDDRVDGRA